MKSKYRLTVFGHASLRAESGEAVAQPSRKALGLLAYLALAPGHAARRELLASLLWPDSDDARARHSLRQTLSSLRVALDDADARVLRADSDSLYLDVASLHVDALRFAQLAASDSAADLAAAADLATGELMHGFSARSADYDDWLTVRRIEHREQLTQLLQDLLDHYEEAVERNAALAVALRLVALDPLREDAQRRLMRLHARAGQTGAALRQYRLCREVLRRDLDVEPEPETRALYQSLAGRRSGRTDTVSDNTLPADNRSPPADEPNRSESLSPAPAPTLATAAPPRAVLRHVVLIAVSAENARDLDPGLDHEERRDRVRECAVTVEQLAQAHGARGAGRVGEAQLAVFGLPRADGSDIERALAMANNLHEAQAPRHFEVRVAIVAGQLLVESGAPASDDARATLVMAIDDAAPLVTQAVTLSQRARGGQTLASEGVRHALGGRVRAERVDEFDFEGNGAYALEPTPGEAPGTPLVGRHVERAVLDGLLRACVDSAVGHAVLLSGEAGIGKTRLVDAIVELAGGLGFVPLREMVQAFGTTETMRPLARLARRLLDRAADDHTEAPLRAGLSGAGLVGAESAVAAALVGLPLDSDGAATLDGMTGPERLEATADVLRALLERSATHEPLLVAIEDLHFADAETRAVVSSLIATVDAARTVLLVVTRPDRDVAEDLQGRSMTRVELGPLRDDDAFALARALTERGVVDPASESFVAASVEQAAGNPLYLEQLLRAGEARGGRLPESMQAMVQVRLDRLPPREQHAIGCAAVLGERFQLAHLRELCGNLEFDPRELVDHHLLRRELDQVVFTHARVQEGVYALLTGGQRRALHAHAAVLFADDLELHALHLARAEHEAAPAALLAAARQALLDFRYDRVEAMAALCPRPRGALGQDAYPWLELRLLAADALRERGTMAAARRAFADLVATIPEVPGGGVSFRDLRCRALTSQAAIATITDDYDEALGLLDEAERNASAARDAAALAEIAYRRGNVYFSLGRLDECLEAHRSSLDGARQAGSPRQAARALSGIGDAHYMTGRITDALESFDECVTLGMEHGFLRIVAGNEAMRGVCLFYLGRLADAHLAVSRGHAIGQRVADRRAELLVANTRHILYEYAGELDALGALLSREVELATELGARRFLADAEAARIRWAVAARQPKKAELATAAALAAQHSVGPGFVGPWLNASIAMSLSGPQDAAARAQLLAEGEALLDAGSLIHNHVFFREIAMRLALGAGDSAEALRHADALRNSLGDEPLPIADFLIARTRHLAGVAPVDAQELSARARVLGLNILAVDTDVQ